MKVLVAEDDPTTRHLLRAYLASWGYEVVEAEAGPEALDALSGRDGPRLGVIDWDLPEVDGVEVCRRVRSDSREGQSPFYGVILTGRGRPGDLVEALEAGADDFLTKPFDPEELRARVRAGERIVTLQTQLQERVVELQAAFGRIQELQGLLPICSYCRQVRDDQQYWRSLESYLGDREAVRFSHSICPSCYDEHLRDDLGELDRQPSKDGSESL